MSDFLLELRSEEIPARMQAGARADLEKLFRKEMDAAGVAVGALTVWSTPRRLALIARDLPLATAAVSEEVKGPRVGAPPQAMEGFLRKTGLTEDQLIERDGVYFAINEKPGRATKDVLAEAIPVIVRAFPWPKSQRWGAASLSSESLRWVRPLSGIVAILGEDLVDCEIGGIASGYATRGHRFHAPGEITIGSASDYQDKLRACHVIVDHAERQDLIRSKAAEAARAAGLTLIADEGLVVENAGLTEWPVPLLGRFDAAFLDVPPEVIQLTARTNQKYFVCEDAAGKLANAFVCTANIVASDGGEAIVAGNRKVLAARLSDARFFWEQDRKVLLEEQAKKLARITFHEKLGTVADKVERVAKLARWLVEEGIVGAGSDSSQSRRPGEGRGLASLSDASDSAEAEQKSPAPAFAGATMSLADQAERAARLCKADLVTEMVGEFPELQGLMGGYYARAEGLPDAVADAIRDHYKPVGQGDDVPTAPVTVAVSLADKLDTILGFFLVRVLPTGSKDPFALRRATLACIQICVSASLRYSIREMVGSWIVILSYQIIENIKNQSNIIEKSNIEYAAKNDQAKQFLELGLLNESVSVLSSITDQEPDDCFIDLAGDICSRHFVSPKLYTEILAFFADRLKVQQREAGVRHDLIDAVFALGGEDDLVRLLARVHALQSFIGTDDGANLLAGYKRAANILKKEAFEADSANPSPEPAEAALIGALDAAEPKAETAIAAEDFTAAMAALASLRGPIDAFFDAVTVNADEPAVRAARLGLLDRFRAAVHKVADFSKIEG